MADAAENKAAPASGGSPVKLIIIMIVGAILLVAVSIGGVFFMMKSMGMLGAGGGHAPVAEAEPSGPALYFPLEPAFVVNFKEKGKTRFLQVTMEVMTRDPLIIEDIKMHIPVIRNNILLYLGNQKAEDLHSTEGKEKIRAELLVKLQEFLKEETGRDKVEGLYFTSFVTQ